MATEVGGCVAEYLRTLIRSSSAAQLDLGEFAPNLRFKPNATIGFGDDMTLVSLNPDISYAFPMENLGKIYVGGLVTFEWWKYTG